jgi:hypothetical protein
MTDRVVFDPGSDLCHFPYGYNGYNSYSGCIKIGVYCIL